MSSGNLILMKVKYLMRTNIRAIIGLIVGLFVGLIVIIVFVLPEAFDLRSFSSGFFWGILFLVIVGSFIFLFTKVKIS
ncbi:MAG: hypothetical protein KGD63_03725 [Candidatus Lokiarchaeota archaeon]|nr:hypothetical protein [Candidatus Lokiarchaeota archaeon]